MQIIINHIDRVRKYVKNDSQNRMMIAIDYNEENNNWERYQIYYNRNMEFSEPFNYKVLHTLEQVGEEMDDIREFFGEIDYICYFDENNEYKEINIKQKNN